MPLPDLADNLPCDHFGNRKTRYQTCFPGWTAPLLLGLLIATVPACNNSPSETDAPALGAGEGELPGEAASHQADLLRYTDVRKQSGIDFTHHFINTESGEIYQINPYDHGSGLCLADVNGDGLEDLYFLDFVGENKLYLNRGGFRFEDVTAASGVKMERVISVGAAFADYDNDGDQDLYVTSYRGGNRLFNNRGDGVFDDVTDLAGVGYDGHSSGVTWFDYDGDGDLDLYVSNIGKFTADTIENQADYYQGLNLMAPILSINRQPDNLHPGEPNILWRNDGNNQFVDVSAEAGLDTPGWNGDATVSDYDQDGDPDVFVANMFGSDTLYQNDGHGVFHDVTESALGVTSWGSVGCRWIDANGDTHPDLYVVDMHSDMWREPDDLDTVSPTEKYPTPWGTRFSESPILGALLTTPAKRIVFGNTFYLNNGDGTFREQSETANLETWWPWGVVNGDWDNDGDEDLFVPAGMGFPFFYWPSSLFVNDGGAVFADATESCGIDPPVEGVSLPDVEIGGVPFSRSSRAATTGDLDQDGDLDLVVNNFNAPPYVLRNDLVSRNGFLRLQLQGTQCNRDAIGARVILTTNRRRVLQERVNAGGYLTQSSVVLHFGLAPEEQPEKVEVFWPWSTEAHVVTSLRAGELNSIRQP